MRKKTTALTCIAFIYFFAAAGSAQQQRADVVVVQFADSRTSEALYKGSYALVIGVGKYAAGWDNLPGVKSDTEAVKAELEKHGFKVEVVLDPTEREFDAKVHFFIKNYGYEPENRLLIYFAGHGYTEVLADGRELGYIVPADAPLPKKDALGFRQKAISMDTIQAYAKQIQSKHALFVFDSCFSGKLVQRGVVAVPPRILEEVKYPVRQFITAGAANQTVPDESIFRRFFVRGLEGKADRNGDGYILGSELADYLKENVTNYSDRRQTPQYGKIRDVDLDRGDFVFVVPKGAASSGSDDKTIAQVKRGQAAEEDKFLGKYRFEAIRTDMEVARENGKLLFKAPGQPTGVLENVGGNRYKITGVPEGFFITFLGNEIYLEQPQGNFYLPRVKADGTTENFAATEGLRELVGIYELNSRADLRLEIAERDGAFLLLIPGQPIQKLREKSKDTFANSLLPDVYLIRANRDASGNLTGISFISPDGEVRYRRVLR
ncbi:MAG: caspase family protein [Acidobacteriota bacterium]|nr:caspase family protein [Acidobacteriota bacterium]